ncbi:MAG TPA: hypothetical protein VMG13_22065, partial [Trebonia sp.]|nr:hypothetical protein [Trebonia sp.]
GAIRGLVVRFPLIYRGQKRKEFRRADQASGMRDKDSLHLHSPSGVSGETQAKYSIKERPAL